jgi:hypothetical protein
MSWLAWPVSEHTEYPLSKFAPASIWFGSKADISQETIRLHRARRDFRGKPANGATRHRPTSVVLTSDESSGPTIERENHRKVLRFTLA